MACNGCPELAFVLAELRALRTELAPLVRPEKSARQVRLERRNAKIIELAEATGLGCTYAAATRLETILAGVTPAPTGMERLIAELRHGDEPVTTARHLWRILASVEADH